MKARWFTFFVVVVAFSLGSRALAYRWVDLRVVSLHLGVAILSDDFSLVQSERVSILRPADSIAALDANVSFSFVATPTVDLSRLQAWTIAAHIHPLDSDPVFWCLLPISSNQTMKLTATISRFGDAFLSATFLSPQIGLSPSGRSLSCSR
jgi:hypothetical protein